ncbi:MAG: 50S ribosomal protein L17 [Elusimicrobia bacterium RIFOXYA2_FULL_39_19]|nr:MAG: 50S ribosomal protein L17 [Elusimicrobia bacterium RIFOXYA2_FULL_39_19]
MLKTSSGKKALLRSLTTSLLIHEQIKTTLPKAKLLRRFAEKIITTAKKQTPAAYRDVARDISDKSVLKKLVEVIAPRYSTQNGGYIRIIKIGQRIGDGAMIAAVKLTQ